MKILYVFPRIPFPVSDGGAKAMADTIELFYKAGYELSFAGFESELHPQSKEQLSRFGHDHTVLGGFKSYSIKDVLMGMFDRSPIQISRRMRPKRFMQSLEMVSQNRFDLIFLDMVHVGAFIPFLRDKFPGTPIIIRAHNKEFEIITDLAVFSNGYKKHLFLNQATKMNSFEKECFRAADAVVFLSEDDKSGFPDLNKSFVVPPSVPTEIEGKYSHTPNEFVVFGSWKWGANLEGLKWFLMNVWEKYSETYPESTLKIIGGGLVLSLASYKGVEYLGFRSDEELDELILKCSASITPLFSGSGIKMKVLKSMAHGIPVIGHKKSFQGIPDIHPNFVCSSPEEFIEAMQNLSSNPDLAKSTSEKNLEFSKLHFSSTSILERYQELFSSLLKP